MRRLASLVLAVIVLACSPAGTCFAAGLRAEDGPARRVCRTRTACASSGARMTAAPAGCCEELPVVTVPGARLMAVSAPAVVTVLELLASVGPAVRPASPVRRVAPLVLRI